MDLLKEANINTKRKAPFYYKFFSLFSVVRGYNIVVMLLAQVLSAIFVFAPNKPLSSVLFDYKLWALVFATASVVAGGYIINHFYDEGKDTINRPIKTQIDTFISQQTKLYSYFILNFLGLGFGLFVSWRAGLFFSVYIFMIWLYSHKLKRYPLTGFFSGALLTILPFFAVFAYYKNFSQVIFAHAGFLFFVLLIRELIKDLENLKGDMLFNYETIVVKYGEHFTRLLVSLIVLLTLIPIYLLLQYPEIGYMKIYFAFAIVLLTMVGVLVWFSTNKKRYVFLHNLLKLIIVTGVLSLILLDTSVIIERLLHGLR
jgi:4-hydroxybenzoate polyprenyltransferase